MITSLIPVTLALPSPSNTTYLIAPALVTDATNNTVIQCWRIPHPFIKSTASGISGAQVLALANITNLAYTILPPRFNGGLHNAPVPQLVHFLSGVAHVTLLESDSELWIVGGKAGLVFAVDTVGTGHVTKYPSDQETVSITAPFEDGEVPEYEVLNDGSCEGTQTFL